MLLEIVNSYEYLFSMNPFVCDLAMWCQMWCQLAPSGTTLSNHKQLDSFNKIQTPYFRV